MLARVTRVPYPIVMVVGGVVLALVPGLPSVRLPPDLVFVVLLPPLLFGGGWSTDARNFKRFIEPILFLALGLVAFTTVVVATFAHAFVGLPLASAFVLGAILSPPDAIATEAIGESLPFPTGIGAVLSGESLINDATALVIYRFAVAAVLTGTFSILAASLEFVYASVAGIAIGLAIAEIVARIQIALRRSGLVDSVTTTVITLVTPFLVYVPAEALHASGVLAVVAAGLLLARRGGEMFGAQERLMVGAAWGVTIFALNGVAFLAIGLQLPAVVAGLSSYSPATLGWYAAATSALVIAARFVWIFASVSIRRAFGDPEKFDFPRIRWPGMVVLSWAGMRGIVTLASALAVPTSLPGGAPFPGRDLIIFLAFVVIVVTLVGQGLTLPFLMRSLAVTKLEDDGESYELARTNATAAARDRLRELAAGFTKPEEREAAERIVAELEAGIPRKADAESHERDRAIRRELSRVVRETIRGMRDGGEISDEVFRDLVHEIDLLDARFA